MAAAASPAPDQRLTAATELAHHVDLYLNHGDHKWDLRAALEKYHWVIESLAPKA